MASEPGIAGMLPSDFVSALLLSPALSEQLARHPDFGTCPFVQSAEQLGVSVYLTVLPWQDLQTTKGCVESLRDNSTASWSWISVSRFGWAGGEVSLYSTSSDFDHQLQSTAQKLQDYITRCKIPGRVSVEQESAIVYADQGVLSEATANELQRRCDDGGNLIPPEDDWYKEVTKNGDDQYRSVLIPEKPSRSWVSALFYNEQLAPNDLVVLACSSESDDSHPVKRFLAAEEASSNQVQWLDSIVDHVLDSKSGTIYTPRVSLPSNIHFLEQWNQSNRKYVRKKYWEANKVAKENREKAKDIILALKSFGCDAIANVERHIEDSCAFDDLTGAIAFQPGYYEFELPHQDSPAVVQGFRRRLIEYFDQRTERLRFDRPFLQRRMYTNSKILLRGQAYYSNLKQVPPWYKAEDYANEIEALLELLENEGDGSQSAKISEILAQVCRQPCLFDDWKLWLGIFDQIRNIGLVAMSAANYAQHQIPPTLTSELNRQLILNSVQLVESYYDVLLGCVARLERPAFCEDVRHSLRVLSSGFTTFANKELSRASEADWYEPSRPIRGWREADHPLENLSVALLAHKAVSVCPKTASRSAVFGVFWGGVELPIVAGYIGRLCNSEFSTVGFLSWGRYSEGVTAISPAYCNLQTGDYMSLDHLARDCEKAILLDDNSLSGTTLREVSRMIQSVGVSAIDPYVVRFSGERREGQIRMDGGGILDPNFLVTQLNGYLGETPYARSYSMRSYENPVGVFNVARSRVLKHLHNNSNASVFKREGF